MAAKEHPSQRSTGEAIGPQPAPAVRGVPFRFEDRARSGWDAAEQRRLSAAVKAHSDLGWRTLRRFGVDLEAIDDALQHAFLILATHPNAPGPDKERQFLVRACIRIAANVRRSQSRRREVPQDFEAPEETRRNPEELLEWKERRHALDRALDSLTIAQRSVFVLFELEGFSLPEIAESLELPLGTVTSRLHRARLAFEAWVKTNRSSGGP